MSEMMEILRVATGAVLAGTCAFLVSELFREMRESRTRSRPRRIDASGRILSERAAELKADALRKAGLS